MSENKECVITIELGTNAVRVVAFDLKGNTLASMKGSYPTFHSEPDYSEQDTDQMFITMLYVLKNMLNERIHPGNFHVTYICFSSSMHSLLAIDKNGVPLGHALTWADNRGKKEARDLKNTALGKVIYEQTGTPIHPMSPLIKIAWFQKHDKEKFRKTYKFLSIKSYIIQQLTQDYLIDYSLASATGLLNIHNLKWETESLNFAGIQESKLPELVSEFHSPGKLRKEYQQSLGLTDDVKIMVGSSDGCMATLGGGIWDGEKAIITIEDSGAVRTVGKKVLKDNKQRFFNYLLTDKYYISGGPTNNGGVIFEWFAQQFGNVKNAFDIEFSIANLIQEASNVPIGSGGLIFLPYLLAERAPIWNPNARGSYFGINIKHERSHFIRAVVEGIIYEIYSIGKTLQEKKKINGLSLHGSFASIPFCAQLISNVFDLPVSVGENPDRIAHGTFLLCGKDMGLYKDLDEAAHSVSLPETYWPQKQNHQLYQKYFQIFESLSTKLTDEFEAISKLQHDYRS